MTRQRASGKFYEIKRGRLGWSAVLYDNSGHSINVINGDSAEDVRGAAQRNWPKVPETRPGRGVGPIRESARYPKPSSQSRFVSRRVAERNNPFEMGFAEAVRLWKSGTTWESISHDPRYDASAFGRGMYAAVEAMSGWYDIAEREARAHGLSREEAEQLAHSIHDSSSPNMLRESTGHRVADFSTLPELVKHARSDLGATHVAGHGAETRIYFPRGDGQYEEATVWQKGNYWHATGPGARQVVRSLPRGAQPLTSQTMRRASEAQGYRPERGTQKTGRRSAHHRVAESSLRVVLSAPSINTPENDWDVVSYALTGEERPAGTKKMGGVTYDIYRTPSGVFIATSGRKPDPQQRQRNRRSR